MPDPTRALGSRRSRENRPGAPASVLFSPDPLLSTTRADARRPDRRPEAPTDERGDIPEDAAAFGEDQNPPSRPTAMGESSSLTIGIAAVTMGTDAESRVPSSRTEPSSWRIDGRPGRTGP